MSAREREGLIARIRQLRRPPAPGETGDRATPSMRGAGQDEMGALEARVAHLEQMVQGLQDSVHRETTRLSKRLGDVEASVQPAALGKALSEDARERGL